MGGSFSGCSRRYRSINSSFFFLLCFHRSGTAACPPAAHPLTQPFKTLLSHICCQSSHWKRLFCSNINSKDTRRCNRCTGRQGGFVRNTHVSGGTSLHALPSLLSRWQRIRTKTTTNKTLFLEGFSTCWCRSYCRNEVVWPNQLCGSTRRQLPVCAELC